RYVKKGSQLFIEGKIRTRSWDDKDGNKRYTTEIIADNMVMLGRKADSTGDRESPAAKPAEQPTNNTSETGMTEPEDPIADSSIDDDLPF
ncbi:MAG: single-stranded DNA-binding protein, partial [Bacteroidales bacterium]|nr:single-stranded DNA-binding protein [Bacteroidales bacterium]